MQVYSRLIGNDHHCCAFHGRSNMPYWCLIGLFAICLCASSMKAVCWNRSHSCLQQKRTMFLRNTLRASPRSPLPRRLSNWKSFIRFLNQTKMEWHWYEDCQTNRSTKIGQTNNGCFSSWATSIHKHKCHSANCEYVHKWIGSDNLHFVQHEKFKSTSSKHSGILEGNSSNRLQSTWHFIST